MRYFFIAGEASGDLHGSGLARAIAKIDPQAQMQGWGGELMEEAGVSITKHYRELAFMGFVEVLLNITTIMRNFRRVKKEILEFRPDVLILVDYPGFNLRMAKWAHERSIPVHYYISPQLWAWKEGRVEKVRRYVDRMYVILPFEKDFYHRHNIDVDYVGHPLLEAIDRYRDNHVQATGKSGVAILAGSRRQEISQMLPVMLETSQAFPVHKVYDCRCPKCSEIILRQICSRSECGQCGYRAG